MREGQRVAGFFDRIRRPLISPVVLVVVAVLVSGLLTFMPRPLPSEAAGIEHRIMAARDIVKSCGSVRPADHAAAS